MDREPGGVGTAVGIVGLIHPKVNVPAPAGQSRVTLVLAYLGLMGKWRQVSGRAVCSVGRLLTSSFHASGSSPATATGDSGGCPALRFLAEAPAHPAGPHLWLTKEHLDLKNGSLG